MKTYFIKISNTILEFEWIVLTLIALPMLFPRPEYTPIMLVIPALWILRGIRDGQPLPSTPMNLPILLLAIMLLVSLWTTFSIGFSLPKISGLIFGFGVFFASVRYSMKSLSKTLIFYVTCGFAVSMLGLFATNWPSKIPVLHDFIDRLPQVITRLPSAEDGIHPNELGGVLLLFVPLLLAVTLQIMRSAKHINRMQFMIVLMSSLWLTALLLLTQSRSALLGLMAACSVILLGSGRIGKWALSIVTGVVVLTILIAGPSSMLGLSGLKSSGSSALGDVGITLRLEIWARGLRSLENYPLSGMGLGTFRTVSPLLYPFYLINPTFDIAHAHNVLLQTGQDFGIIGIMIILAILFVSISCLYRTFRSKSCTWNLWGIEIDPSLGLIGSVVGFFVYSLTDAIALGARPGFLIWMLLGIGVGSSISMATRTISTKNSGSMSGILERRFSQQAG